MKKIFLIKRGGGCKFTTKVLNAQIMGADAAVIYDDIESSTPEVVMKNDGHGHLVNIPSIFISSQDGEKLVSAYRDCGNSEIIKIEFAVHQTEIAQLTLWLDPYNRETYILLRDFLEQDYYRVIESFVDLKVRFKSEKGCLSGLCKPSDCYGKGSRYCSKLPHI